MRVIVRSRKARSCETTARPPAKRPTKRSSRSSPSKSRSFVGSSSRRKSKRESRIAASPARAASPPESVVISCSRATGSPSSAQTVPARCAKIGTAQCQKLLQRGRVALGSQSAEWRCDRRLGRRHARAPREIAEQRLARARVVLLREVADRGRGRRALDLPVVRLLVAREQAEQRRLAGPVRPDEPEPRARAERQVDAVEDDVGAVRLADAGERDSHETSCEDGRRGQRAGSGRGKRLCLASVRHERAPERHPQLTAGPAAPPARPSSGRGARRRGCAARRSGPCRRPGRGRRSRAHAGSGRAARSRSRRAPRR